MQSNLICQLTAFIVWDEAEQVAVATHALVQPALEDAGAGAGFGLCDSLRRASMGVRPARSTFMLGRGGPVTFGATAPDPQQMPPPPPSSLPPEPTSVVNRIVEHLHSSYLAYPGEPFSPDERRVAFERVLAGIRDRLSRPEWKPLCDAILAWAFGDARDANGRSNLVAELLSRLTCQLDDIGALRQRVAAQAGELRRASLAAAEVLDRMEKVLQKDGPLQGPLAELLAALRHSRELWRGNRLEETLARIAQVEVDIHEQLAKFQQSVSQK